MYIYIQLTPIQGLTFVSANESKPQCLLRTLRKYGMYTCIYIYMHIIHIYIIHIYNMDTYRYVYMALFRSHSAVFPMLSHIFIDILSHLFIDTQISIPIFSYRFMLSYYLFPLINHSRSNCFLQLLFLFLTAAIPFLSISNHTISNDSSDNSCSLSSRSYYLLWLSSESCIKTFVVYFASG